MHEPIFTDHRRDLIAKTLADVLKIAFAAALASKLFVEFPPQLRWSLAIIVPLAVIMTILICPKDREKG